MQSPLWTVAADALFDSCVVPGPATEALHMLPAHVHCKLPHNSPMRGPNIKLAAWCLAYPCRPSQA